MRAITSLEINPPLGLYSHVHPYETLPYTHLNAYFTVQLYANSFLYMALQSAK